MLKVDEIFLSIQGESTLAGLPTVFVRLYGCPLNCIYCDQPQQEENAREMSIADIIEEINLVSKGKVFKSVCITGGEPLAQAETIKLAETLLSVKFVSKQTELARYQIMVEIGIIPINSLWI